MLAQVAQAGGAQNGVGRGVQDHVAVAVGQGPAVVRHTNAGQDQAAVLDEAVNVEPDSDTHGRFHDGPDSRYAGARV